jgi:hypothetical protein
VAAEAEGEAAEAEVAASAEATKKKDSGIAFSTKRMMTTTQTIAQTRKGLRPSSKKRRRRNRGTNYINHYALAWQNPNFGRNLFASPFQPPHFQPPIELPLNRHLGNPMFSMLKTLSVGLLSST